MNFELPQINLLRMLPEMFLFFWALVVFTYDLVTKRRSESSAGILTLIGLILTGVIIAILSAAGSVEKGTGYYGSGFGMMFVNDPLSLFFKIIFLGAAFLAVASSFGIMKQKIINHRGEYYGLILFSTVGMMFLGSSNELLSLYIGLELTTVPLFVLAAFFKDNRLSVEAGIKYLIIGAFSSALLVYGLSFLYGLSAGPGLSATTDILQGRINIGLTHIRQLQAHGDLGFVLVVSMILMLAGIGFKLALPPFHQWAPDVYEGSPTPIAAFLSIGSKGAGLVAFAKIFVIGLPAFFDPFMAPNDWGILVSILAAAAMIVGNVAAIRQTNIKRMLAYSSIAQAGYIMVGMVAMNSLGLSSVAFYIFAYMFANMGAFAIVAIFEDKTGSTEIQSYTGLAKSSPFMAASMSVFLLSLAGIPPLGGFLAKYYVFAAAVKHAALVSYNQWMYWLVGVGLLTSVFALYYYANIIKTMFFSSEDSPYKLNFMNPGTIVVIIGLLGVFYCGLFPEPILRFAQSIPAIVGLAGN
jgi:NADH-quinone oxidoreductase subunit N